MKTNVLWPEPAETVELDVDTESTIVDLRCGQFPKPDETTPVIARARRRRFPRLRGRRRTAADEHAKTTPRLFTGNGAGTDTNALCRRLGLPVSDPILRHGFQRSVPVARSRSSILVVLLSLAGALVAALCLSRVSTVRQRASQAPQAERAFERAMPATATPTLPNLDLDYVGRRGLVTHEDAEAEVAVVRELSRSRATHERARNRRSRRRHASAEPVEAPMADPVAARRSTRSLAISTPDF